MGSRGTYSTSSRKYGNEMKFYGGKGYANIDVSFNGGKTVDMINMYDYARGESEQQSRKDFLRAVHEYVRELTKHDADEFRLIR